MATQIRSGAYGFSEFLELVREDQKADLLNGAIFMASPENVAHNQLVGWLYRLLQEFVERRDLGIVTINRVAYRLSSRSAPEPDLAFVAKARSQIIKPGYVDGPPDLAIEVVSPDSADRDLVHKRELYESAGVREYWIIDADDNRAQFLVLDSARYTDGPLVEGWFRSTVLQGFQLNPEHLWDDSRPPVGRLLDEMDL